MEYKQIGIIAGTKGYKGDILFKDVTSGLKKLAKGTSVLVGYSQQFSKDYHLSKWELYGNKIIIKFTEINTKEEAEQLKEQGVFAPVNKLKYENDDSYFVKDIIGCSVYDVSEKKEIGTVKEVWRMKANDIWVVDSEPGEILLPYIDDVIKKVDLKKKKIDVFMIPGLADLNFKIEK